MSGGGGPVLHDPWVRDDPARAPAALLQTIRRRLAGARRELLLFDGLEPLLFWTVVPPPAERE